MAIFLALHSLVSGVDLCCQSGELMSLLHPLLTFMIGCFLKKTGWKSPSYTACRVKSKPNWMFLSKILIGNRTLLIDKIKYDSLLL